MNPLVFWLADGTGFFIGMGLVGIGLPLLCLAGSRRFAPLALTTAIIMGVLIAILSSAPLPAWLHILWSTVAGISLVLCLAHPRTNMLRRASRLAALLVAGLSAALALAELPYHLAPTIVIPAKLRIHVIGDSISAGIRSGDRPWPAILSDLLGLAVENLARPAATVQSAMTQAETIPDGDGLVLVEIGGNDLLGGTDTVPAKCAKC